MAADDALALEDWLLRLDAWLLDAEPDGALLLEDPPLDALLPPLEPEGLVADALVAELDPPVGELADPVGTDVATLLEGCPSVALLVAR